MVEPGSCSTDFGGYNITRVHQSEHSRFCFLLTFIHAHNSMDFDLRLIAKTIDLRSILSYPSKRPIVTTHCAVCPVLFEQLGSMILLIYQSLSDDNETIKIALSSLTMLDFLVHFFEVPVSFIRLIWSVREQRWSCFRVTKDCLSSNWSSNIRWYEWNALSRPLPLYEVPVTEFGLLN